MLNRRHFLQTTAVTAAAYAQGGPKRIAIVAGAYRADSPAGNLGDRFLVGYPYAGVWRKPAVKVASLYVEQKGAGDLSGDRAREFGLQAAASVAEAVKGADGVLLFEARLFDECVKAFEQAGRAAPVYLYKDLGPSFEKAKAMVDASRRLRFPLMAAAAGPFTWRTPAIDLPMNAEVEAALVATAAGGVRRDRESAVDGGAAAGRRERREVGGARRRGCGLEGVGRWADFEGVAGGGAFAQRYAARAHR
jgi:hypothetical protein